MEDESDWTTIRDDLRILWKDSNGIIKKELWIPSGNIFYLDEEGKIHRDDGPAFLSVKAEYWYWHGKYIDCETQKEFDRLIKLKAFW